MAQSNSTLLVTSTNSTLIPHTSSLLSRVPKRSSLCSSNSWLSYKAHNLPPKNNYPWPLQLSSSSSTPVRTRGPLSSPGEQSENHGEQLVFPNISPKMLQNTLASFLIFIQVSFALPIFDWNPEAINPAHAVLYSPNTNVPRSGDVALRRAIPANSNMKTIQDALEDVSFLMRIPQRKPFGTMEADIKKAIKVAVEEKDSIMSNFPSENKEKGSMLYTSLLDGKGGLQDLVKFIKKNDIDKIYIGLANSLDTVAEMELLQAPGLSFLLPDEYLKYPRLTGRGVVEFTIEKGDGSTFFPSGGGESKSTATLQVVLDGYSAPLTSGNFANLVTSGAYDGIKLGCTPQAILADDVPPNAAYSVPLELMPSGQFEPLYKTMLSIQDGELPVLPLSVYGAVAMSHSADSEEYSSPSQFFFYLYDKKSAGLGGLSFDEGQFSVFGYVTAGRDVLAQIKAGDFIRSAKLVQGQDRLVLPNTG